MAANPLPPLVTTEEPPQTGPKNVALEMPVQPFTVIGYKRPSQYDKAHWRAARGAGRPVSRMLRKIGRRKAMPARGCSGSPRKDRVRRCAGNNAPPGYKMRDCLRESRFDILVPPAVGRLLPIARCCWQPHPHGPRGPLLQSVRRLLPDRFRLAGRHEYTG